MVKKPVGFLLGTGGLSHPIPIYEENFTTLGRDEGNTIALEDLAASRRHASIEGRAGSIYITDLDSSTGTFVDDVRINSHERFRLLSGQEIRIGGKVFYVVSADAPQETQQKALSRAGAFSKRNTLLSKKGAKPVAQIPTPVRTPIPFASIPTPAKTPIPYASIPTPSKTPIPPAANLTPVPLPGRGKKMTTRMTRRMTKRLTKRITKKHIPPVDTEEHALSGDVSTGGLPHIIQMINSKRFSGIMKVFGNSLTATVLFVNGDLYAAFCGREIGIEAIYACAVEKNTRFTFDKLDVSAVQITLRNITRPTMQILMDCCCKIHDAET